jgi:signal transduction histidine kinase/CheY-like chemotaxis protein
MRMNDSQILRRSEERNQSIIRMAISSSTFVLLIAFNLIRDGHLAQSLVYGLSAIITHFVFSVVWHQYLIKKPDAWPPRIYVSMVVDISTTTLAFYFAARFGSFFYPVFLWVIVGYGLRYGKRALLASALIGFAEFGMVLKFNHYWQDNLLTGVGFWWGILILPSFFLTVLKRLGALNGKLQVELGNSQAAEKAKGEFLANMSHEIRTPLNGVLGMAQILEDSDIGPEGRRDLDILRCSATSLLDIVNDILDFSKITSGKMTIEAIPFDLHGVLNDVLQILSPAAAAKGLSLDFQYPEEAPRGFVGDPVRVRQIALNLASNAVKFTEAGSIAIKVSVTLEPGSRALVALDVEDTGLGIPEDRLPAIFKQFEQVNESTTRNFGGTGLGLAISNHLAQKLGGDIRVRSVVGEGSVFTANLALPIADVERKEVDQTTTLPRFDLKVLVAEDNAVNRLVIGKLLKKVGIDAAFANDGREAIEHLENGEFDLVFMDVRMPVMDGLEATRLLRGRTDELAQIPIIALTADADSDSARRCLEAGMNLHLGKPVILETAIQAIESLNISVPV